MKIDLKESLNELDIISDNRYDLYNIYLSKNPSIGTKKKLAEAIYKNKSPKEIALILKEDWDDAAWHDTADQEQVDQPDYLPDGEEESEWKEMDSKSVRDSDGFLTDYTWYWRNNNGEDQHVFVFGDSDLYGPEDGYFDWECDSLEEAQEWFDSYVGPGDDEDDWMDESLKGDFTENDLVKGKKFVNKNGAEITIVEPTKDGKVQFIVKGKSFSPDCGGGSKKGIFNMLKKNGYSLKEDVSKEWKPNLNFKHIKDVLEKALSRGKYINNEREEVKAALDLCDKKQKYTPEQRKFIQDSHREMWKKNRKTESLKESNALDSFKELENNGWTVLSNGIRGGDTKYYWLARKLINGKGSWKAINDETGEVIDISYDQALGREPINGSEGVNNLSKFLGKKLLPNRVRVEESIDDTHKDFEIARKQWNKLNTDIDFDSALDEWNKSSELAEPDTWYAKPLYSEEAWNDMVSMFSNMDESLDESLKEEYWYDTNITNIFKRFYGKGYDYANQIINNSIEELVDKYDGKWDSNEGKALEKVYKKIGKKSWQTAFNETDSKDDIDSFMKKYKDTLPKTLKESLDEAMVRVEPSDKELNQVINVLTKYGFKLDDNYKPGRGLFGSYHIQVINPDLDYIDFDQLVADVGPLGDALDNLSLDIDMPITYSFGSNDDNVITGGIDIHVGYKDDGIDESLKEDLNLDDFMEPVDQIGKAKIYYDSNKRTYFTPSLDLDFETLDQAKDFIGAPLYMGESLKEDWFDDMIKDGKKYTIFGESSKGGLKQFYTDNPKIAIKKWFEFQKNCPYNVHISTVLKSDALELLKNASEDYLTSLYSRYGSPYKLEYLIDSVKTQIDNGCRGFYEKYGDQIEPFSVG